MIATIENVKDLTVDKNGIKIIGKVQGYIADEITLQQHGADRHELATELIKKLTHEFYNDYKNTYTEATAKELLKDVLEDIMLETMSLEAEWL